MRVDAKHLTFTPTMNPELPWRPEALRKRTAAGSSPG
jgi:hypothetical protein